MAANEDTFAALVARARQGDEQAIAQLVQQYEPEVRRAVRGHLSPALRPLVETVDLVQSVHCCLLAGLRRNQFELAAPENLIALAVTLVRRKIARHWRRLKKQAAWENRQRSLADAAPAPVSDDGLQDTVRQFLDSLDDTERRVMELRLQGHSTAEVARKLGLNADVLRARLSQLRKRLRANGTFKDWL